MSMRNHWRNPPRRFISYSMYKDEADQREEPGDQSMPRMDTASRTARVLAVERSAKALLCACDQRYRVLTKAQRRALLIGFAMCNKPLAGAAFDAVRLEGAVDLDDPEDIAANNRLIVLIELKSTGQGRIAQDLCGYFFNITSAELLIAQGLRDQYRFAFFNTVRGDCLELSLAEVMSRAKAIYPAYHIRF